MTWNVLDSSAYAPAMMPKTFPELLVLGSDSTGPGEPGCESSSEVGGADLLLSFLDGVGEGDRCRLGMRCPGRKGFHVGKSAVSECFSYIPGEVDQA